MPNDSAFSPAHWNHSGNYSSVYSPYSTNGSVYSPYSTNGSVYSSNPSNGSVVVVANVSGYSSVAEVSYKVERPNTALLSTILTVGTFLIAYFLRVFRNSKFLGRSVSVCSKSDQ